MDSSLRTTSPRDPSRDARETTAAAPAQIAKAALRRLAMAQQEPTPENYARAYNEELGLSARPVLPGRATAVFDRIAAAVFRDETQRAALVQAFTQGHWPNVERLVEQRGHEDLAQSQALAGLFERLVRGLERPNKSWTVARKKDSLQTVLDGSRSDAQRLRQRLGQLVASWENDEPDASATAQPAEAPGSTAAVPAEAAAAAAPAAAAPRSSHWPAAAGQAVATLRSVLPEDEPRAGPVSRALHEALGGLQRSDGSCGDAAEALARECDQAERLLQRRHLLLQQMHQLCEELTAGLTDLAEDDSWARGQCDAMRHKLQEGLSARSLRSVSALLHDTRTRQRHLRVEREQARDALKSLIHQMLQEVGELGTATGRFGDNLGRYADVIESADSLESLAGAVREMVAEGRAVQAVVRQTQQRLQDEHGRASALSSRVQSLEDELRRLSDEVSTDQLTQIANRRGLIRAFETEQARTERQGTPLALGLLDVDNFKRLNDDLGHAAGDEALKSLAARIQQQLRPTDLVARYGGEEFVVMLPDTPIDEAQQVLSRMQRAMTEALFMHESRQIFVTFSAGVTHYRPGERLEAALERADEALYEAKRTGKNRTCVG